MHGEYATCLTLLKFPMGSPPHAWGIPNHDREYLVGTANNMTTTQIANLMNYQKSAKQQQNYVNQYRRRMIQQDLIRPAGNGRVRFKLPLFKEYLADTQNPDSIRYNPLI